MQLTQRRQFYKQNRGLGRRISVFVSYKVISWHISSKFMVCVRFLQSFMLLVSIFFFVSIFCNSTLKLRLSPSSRLLADKQGSVHETGEERNQHSNLSETQNRYMGSRNIISWHDGLMGANKSHSLCSCWFTIAMTAYNDLNSLEKQQHVYITTCIKMYTGERVDCML